MLKHYYSFILLWLAILLQGCYSMKPSNGGGDTQKIESKNTSASGIALPKGYKIEAVATGLTFPAGITFDDQGQAYVVEAGYSYGEVFTEPRLLKLDPDGKTTTIAKGEKNGPWSGVSFYNNNFYVAEGGTMEGGKILQISKDGNITALVEDLPTYGDHHTNGPLISNGYLYFGLGTATNSGIVGEDNAKFGWLKRKPEFHDIPCRDIVLRGRNYESSYVLTEEKGDKAMTGAFVAYGTPTSDGQIIRGSIPCSGAVIRMSLQGGALELVAWGFRNPFGLAMYNNQLYVSDNAYDVRGSRPVWGTGDLLWKVKSGEWYGWPDYSGHHSLDKHEFKVPKKNHTDLLLKEHPSKPPKPAAILGVHSSSNSMDFSQSDDFGFKGQLFIAQFGDMAPNVGKVLGPVGYKVVMVDVETGVVNDFAVNEGNRNGPASMHKRPGLERPVAAKFSPDGKSLYIVDFGVVQIEGEETKPKQNTGTIWKVTKQ